MVGFAGGGLTHVKMIFGMPTNSNGIVVIDAASLRESHGTRKSLFIVATGYFAEGIRLMTLFHFYDLLRYLR